MAERDTPEDEGATPLVSVVVCTHNRAEKLRACLAGLADQSLEPHEYEIVVVDDASSDATTAAVSEFPVRTVRNRSNLGPAASRNVGVRLARSPIVAFTDDDCVPDKNWLTELLAVFDDPEVLGVGGRIVPLRTDGLLLRYYELNNPLAHNTNEAAATGTILERFWAYLRGSFRLNSIAEDDDQLITLTGANMSVRRAALDLVGGFDDRFNSVGAEDTDLSLRLREARPDGLLRYAPHAVVAHDYDPHLRDALRRSRTYGHAAAFAYRLGRRRLPAIFPFPLLITATLALSAVTPILLTVPAALLLLLYPGWARIAIGRRNPAYLGYAPLQALLELWTMAGSLEYLLGRAQGTWDRPPPES
jgi:GT2 family glycosyltransferase